MRHLTPLLLVLGMASALAGEELTLVADGRADYVIVLPADVTAPIQTAARELQEHLQHVTGTQLAIVPDDGVASDARQILLGPSPRVRQLIPELDITSLGHDGIVVKTVGDTLVLTGQGSRGTLYAVYTFLEDVVGCRWWTSTERYLPKKPTLRIPSQNIQYAPKLRYREAFYRDAFESVFAARLKLNGHHHRVSEEFGGHYGFVGFVHTFFSLLPPSKYFDQHPEWYSEIDGTRVAERAQLCLTNEAMRQELVRNALQRLRDNPGAGLISVSQNDWRGRCQCTKCLAVEEEEDSPAGPLLRFVNRVAEDIEVEFPEFLIETLAYQYTRKPPRKVKPRHNVVIRLCSIECSFIQPLGDGEQNEAFRNDIEGWSRIAPQLFIWNYVTNFSSYLVPHPNLRVLAPNVRFFVENHTIGLFEQGDSQSTIGDFIRLRAWLLAHLMWDPSQDEKALIREFLAGYYGPAAPYLEKYLEVIHDAGERSGIYLRCFMSDTSSYLGLDDLNEATRLFQSAMDAVADDAVLSKRVRRERLPLDHVWLRRYYALRRAAKSHEKEFLGPSDPVIASEEFIRLAHEWKVGNWRERRPFTEYEESLRTRFRPAGPPPALCQGLADDDWIDLQDNQFRLAQRGQWAEIVDDAQASDGKAVRMPGDHFEWAVHMPLSDDLTYGNPWRCYVVARVEAQANDGRAMTMGIYDARAKRSVANRTVTVQEAASDYRVYDLGTYEIHGGMYLWAAPPKRPGDIEAVSIDRMFLIRSTAKSQK